MPKNETTVETRFQDLLREHRSGGLEYDVSNEMRNLVDAVRSTSKGGSITITLKIAPINGDPNKVLLTDEVKVNIPKPAKGGSLFWTTDHGGLVGRNPNQLDLPIDQPVR